ncbi:MAG: sigma-70 family RNA polymerase sigma factor [Acidobacteria bacterium]|nr:sigma-70 family RNA polymerase sigma factor [Acidobacteriota bacterium]
MKQLNQHRPIEDDEQDDYEVPDGGDSEPPSTNNQQPAGEQENSPETSIADKRDPKDRLWLLIAENRETVRRMLLAEFGKHESLVDDALSKASLGIVNSSNPFRGDSEFSTYFYSAARRALLSMIPKPPLPNENCGGKVGKPASLGLTPEQEVAAAEEHRKLRILQWEVMKELEIIDRRMLRYWGEEKCSRAEIAKRLGIKETNVQHRLCCARNNYKRKLKSVLRRPRHTGCQDILKRYLPSLF